MSGVRHAPVRSAHVCQGCGCSFEFCICDTGDADTLRQRRLQMIERSAVVKRYHTEPTSRTQTVGEHTYGVVWLTALMSQELDVPITVELLMGALAHDAAEHAVGDVPSPTKRDPAVRAAFDLAEAMHMDSLGLEDVANPTPELAAVIKLADIMEGIMFCTAEVRRGNADMKLSLRNYVAYAEQQPKLGPTAHYLLDKAKEQL